MRRAFSLRATRQRPLFSSIPGLRGLSFGRKEWTLCVIFHPPPTSTKAASICCPSNWDKCAVLLWLDIRKKVKMIKAADVNLVEDENGLYFVL